MNLHIYLYGTLSLCNIFLINEFVDDDYKKYIMYFVNILQSIVSIIIIKDDDEFINRLKFNCYFLKKIIMEKDKKFMHYLKMNQTKLIKKNNENENKENENENEIKCDNNNIDENITSSPLISNKKND